jgi:conflict system STAND superfamily ATPase
LLAFTLRRLYGGDGHLSVDEYESLGRLKAPSGRRPSGSSRRPTPPQKRSRRCTAPSCRPWYGSTPGGYARRRARFDDLPRRALALLRRFVDARLLVTDRDPKNRETIEVAHEALLRTWPLLGGWLAEDQDKLRLLERLQRSAEEWDQGGRRDDLLVYRNGRLKEVEALLANPRFTMPEASVERAYLNASSAGQRVRQAAEKEEQERRIRDAERIAEEQKKAAREAQRANAALLAIAAEKEKDHSIDLALLLANEAVAAASEPTPEAQSARSIRLC